MNILRFGSIAAIACALLGGCTAPRQRALFEYTAFNHAPRVILPDDYVDYLKKEKFTHGELNDLPRVAIILHHDDVEDYLKQLGYTPDEWTKLQTGSTDPNLMFIVQPKRDGAKPFIVNRGLPGAGGVSTQAAELAALGVKQIVHIGTAGFIGTSLPDRAIVISNGSYKDGAAVLLSDDPGMRIASPSLELSVELLAVTAKHQGGTSRARFGYTSPIFYYQPEALVRELITGSQFAAPRPEFVEMEEAPLFETARRADIAAASIVVGSDRYRIDDKGKLVHDYFDSTTAQELEAMRIAIEVLSSDSFLRAAFK